VNDLILNACVKTTEMFICEKILTTSDKKITANPYTNAFLYDLIASKISIISYF
jgi:hypothetical protein